MLIPIDIGYFETKTLHPKTGKNRSVRSVVADCTERSLGFENGHNIITRYDEYKKPITTHIVGNDAISASRFATHNEDRNWFKSDAYMSLYGVCLCNATDSNHTQGVNIVTGLPISFFNEDRAALADTMSGLHRFKVNEERMKGFVVGDVIVMPQPYGAYFYVAYDRNSRKLNPDFNGTVNVVDIGGKTTNLCKIQGQNYLPDESHSVSIGGWTISEEVKKEIISTFGVDDPSPTNVQRAVIHKTYPHKGQSVDVSNITDTVKVKVFQAIMSEMSKIWDIDETDHFIISGGTSRLLFDLFQANIGHSILIDDPVLGNVRGYELYGRHNGL